MKSVVWAAAIVVALYALHRLASWAESRGWIRYRRGGGRGSSAALGNALLEVQTLIEPSKRHVLEEQCKERSESEESGDPPQPGGGSSSA
jgi:hypothetical protein